MCNNCPYENEYVPFGLDPCTYFCTLDLQERGPYRPTSKTDLISFEQSLDEEHKNCGQLQRREIILACAEEQDILS